MPVTFPGLELPAGWTREVRGPRLWLMPPEPGGRIIVPPIQQRPRWLHADVFLDHVLLQERDRRFKKTAPAPITSRDDQPGICVDVAALDRAGEPTEWRTYAVFIIDRRALAVLYLQCAPARFGELRAVFLALAASTSVLAGASVAPG